MNVPTFTDCTVFPQYTLANKVPKSKLCSTKGYVNPISYYLKVENNSERFAIDFSEVLTFLQTRGATVILRLPDQQTLQSYVNNDDRMVEELRR